jgi:CheY-like chemotaxis protein
MVLLLVEREESGKQLEMHLAEQGFEVEVLVAGEGRGWLTQMIARPPGGVVLDLGMASGRGWEVLRVLKGHPVTRDVPVLFYTLGESGGAVLEMDYLAKPVGTADLARALEGQGLVDAQEGRTVLVVDDEPAVLEMHARVVEARLPGCRVLEACDGREALRVIREEVPDLVLLDLMMPEVDGFAVLEGMQEGETTRGIPVIVLTGQELAVEDMERLNRGVAAVLGKGLFSAEETLTRIEETLAREHRLGNEAQRVVRRAMAYVHEHYADPISRADIAGHVGWGEDHLGRCFRRELGVSPIVYLTRTRIKQARQLLEEGKSVSWVAMAVGFSSRNYFSDVFRREVGMSPSAFRKSRRRGG